MTREELLESINNSLSARNYRTPHIALIEIVEMAFKKIDASEVSAEQVQWFYEGYNLAMDNILDAIEKEMV